MSTCSTVRLVVWVNAVGSIVCRAEPESLRPVIDFRPIRVLALISWSGLSPRSRISSFFWLWKTPSGSDVILFPASCSDLILVRLTNASGLIWMTALFFRDTVVRLWRWSKVSPVMFLMQFPLRSNSLVSADIFLGTCVRFLSLSQTEYILSQLMVIFGVSGRLVVVSSFWERSSVVTSCIPCVSYSLAKEVLLK